jgi:hypothetical protein
MWATSLSNEAVAEVIEDQFCLEVCHEDGSHDELAFDSDYRY